MRAYTPPTERLVSTKLPDGFSDQFIADLLASLPTDEYGDFKVTYLKEQLLTKYCDPRATTAAVRKDRAIEKWLSTERRNARTNRRLLLDEPTFSWCEYRIFVSRCRSLIARILGPLEYPDVILDVVHTNGASTRVKRQATAALRKLEGEAHVSESALKHWLQSASSTRLASQTLELNESSVLFTVPKKSDIDRCACKEPEINMLLQRSVGGVIRRRLRRHGINLNDQSRNRRLAARAVNDRLATIDLSSASDSISRQLVFNLLPFDWWSLLSDLRVTHTLVGEESHELEMFSSMGNGFTFELESLLFYAITSTVCRLLKVEGQISVFGDDIIAPSACVPYLIQMLGFLGFKTNEDKTFWTGTFRESCGKHYDRGLDVSPFFVRRPVSSLPDLINILNRTLEWDGRGYGFFQTDSLARFHRHYSQYVPPFLWGGVEPDDATALVTGHAPRFRLVPKTKRVSRPEVAALTHWFMSRESSDKPIAVEPITDVAHKAARQPKGWITTWKPWLLLAGAQDSLTAAVKHRY